ncbi:MAG TPA: PKD domain-containing protein [Microthrixaceae bacterium]|nr:PKD domain-containing protein [Microthrixaceae bacterium]
MSPSRSRFSHRPQSGYTLIELLTAIAITAIIFVPLMAWTTLALRQQPVTQEGLLRTAQTGLLGSMFPSDVSVAAQAWVNGMSEPWATDCDGGTAEGGSMQLVMITGGATIQKVVYVVAKSSDDPTQMSIWRRSCGVGADNTVKREHQLFKGVRPGLTSITCKSPSGDTPCREITLNTKPIKNDQALIMSATRRVDASSVPLDALGNPLPVAVITLESRTAMQPVKAVFSADRSTVGLARTIASYSWEFESDVTATDLSKPQVSAQFPELAPGQERREFTVRLTITDDLGATNTAYFKISSSNLDPVAVISSITPNPVAAGQVVTMTALPTGGQPGSYDPDGAIVRFEWALSLPQVDPDIPAEQIWLNGPTVTYTTKTADIGQVDVMLSVTDLQLGQSTAFGSFGVVDPSTDPNPTTTIPTTTVPGALLAVFADSPGANQLTRTFDASASQGVVDGATYAWRFGDGSTGDGVTASREFPNGGTYTVTLTVTNPDGTVSTATRPIQIAGNSPAPINVRHNGTSVLWDPVVGARRYLVDFEFRTPTDCLRSIANQAVGAGPAPSKAIPQSLCSPRLATARARVGTDSGTSVTWSGWIVIPALGTVPPTTTPPEVVK